MARPAAAPLVGYLLLADDVEREQQEPGRGPGVAALLDALGVHSPTLEPDPPAGCWLDLRGGRRGPPPAARAAAVLATARAWGHAGARLGVAPTPGVARLAAAHGAANPAVLLAGDVAAFLAPLPVMATGLDGEFAARLALVGLRTLGDLAALPRGALGDYLGAPAAGLEAVARGEDGRPLRPWRPPLALTARRELDFALDDRGALAALLGRLLAPPLAELRRRGLGATRATLTLERGTGRPLTAEMALATPATTPAALLAPLLAALPAAAGDGSEDDADEAGAGVTAVALALAAPRVPQARQASFFDVPTGREARLRAGVGEARRRAAGRLGRYRLADPAHPLPECRYAFADVAGDGEGGSA
ncbi:MAG TPA: hypothetical protein VFL91_14510 [Thermomicrobiales bacterium]|nr:hypothetical protein [Thermomicrobiales bacterium]